MPKVIELGEPAPEIDPMNISTTKEPEESIGVTNDGLQENRDIQQEQIPNISENLDSDSEEPQKVNKWEQPEESKIIFEKENKGEVTSFDQMMITN